MDVRLKKMKSLLNKILPERKAQTSRNIPINKYLNPEKNIFQDIPKAKGISERWCGKK